jgi:hypothetical protein
MEIYLHSPDTSSWRGAYLRTGTTLPDEFEVRLSEPTPEQISSYLLYEKSVINITEHSRKYPVGCKIFKTLMTFLFLIERLDFGSYAFVS